MNIEAYNKILQKYLLQKVVIKCENKVLKTGKLKLFNIKQYFIRFSIENDKKEIKQLELPYPFLLHDSEDNCTLNYHISSLAGNSKSVSNCIRKLSNKESMKMYDRLVQIIPVKS